LGSDLAAGVASAEGDSSVTAEMIMRAYVRYDVVYQTTPTDRDGLLCVEGLVEEVVATFGVDEASARGLVDGVLDELTDQYAEAYIAAMD
jgi:hypothetical protein